jgi:hypothetical protein
LYAGEIGNVFILMDDNARPHTVNVVLKYLERQGIIRLDWPARSQDLNLIEHLWNEIQVRISARQVQPRSTQEFDAALVDEWNTIPLAVLRNLIGGMQRRCQAVIDNTGSLAIKAKSVIWKDFWGQK